MRRDFVRGLLLVSIAWHAAATEIYLCKTAQGGEFWSSGACSNAGGYMVDIVQVPGNMPFKEQANFADQLRNKKATANAQAENASARQHQCAVIDAELRQISLASMRVESTCGRRRWVPIRYARASSMRLVLSYFAKAAKLQAKCPNGLRSTPL
jgi:hypothetical protein